MFISPPSHCGDSGSNPSITIFFTKFDVDKTFAIDSFGASCLPVYVFVRNSHQQTYNFINRFENTISSNKAKAGTTYFEGNFKI